MEHNGKEKKPYNGTLIICVIMIGLPIAIFYLFLFVINKWQSHYPAELNLASAKALGFGVGLMLQACFALSGAFAESKQAVKDRLSNFRDNASLSLGFAIKNYFRDMVEDGVAYLIYMSMIIVTACLCIDGLSYCITYLMG